MNENLIGRSLDTKSYKLLRSEIAELPYKYAVKIMMIVESMIPVYEQVKEMKKDDDSRPAES